MPGADREWNPYAATAVIKALEALWGREPSAGLSRSCLATVVIVREEGVTGGVPDGVLKALPAQFPCRLIDVTLAPHGGSAAVLFSVATSCAMGRRGRICCETIRLRVAPDAAGALPNIIAAMAVSDLPRIALFSGMTSPERVRLIAPHCDRMVVDSACCNAAHGAFFFAGTSVAVDTAKGFSANPCFSMSKELRGSGYACSPDDSRNSDGSVSLHTSHSVAQMGQQMTCGNAAWTRLEPWREAFRRTPESFLPGDFFHMLRIGHAADMASQRDALLLKAWFCVHGVPDDAVALVRTDGKPHGCQHGVTSGVFFCEALDADGLVRMRTAPVCVARQLSAVNDEICAAGHVHHVSDRGLCVQIFRDAHPQRTYYIPSWPVSDDAAWLQQVQAAVTHPVYISAHRHFVTLLAQLDGEG